MIAIYCREVSGWAEILREELRRAMFPCAVVGPEYGCTTLLERVPFVILDPSAAADDPIVRRIPQDKIITWAEDSTPIPVLYEEFRARFGNDPPHLRCTGIRFTDNKLRYRGIPISLTPNEKRIAILLLACRGTYFSAEEITALCLKTSNPNAAAVHICNMNEKAVGLTAHRLIECRRFSGYRIPPEAKREWIKTIL